MEAIPGFADIQDQEIQVPQPSRVPEGHYVQWANACIAGYGKNGVSSPFEYAVTRRKRS
jgi:hypothetical protein